MIIWKDVPFAPEYQVNNVGEVRSLTRYVKYSDGRVCRKEGRILKPMKKCNGYLVVEIKEKERKIHRLVWEAFNGPIPEGMEVNHINEDKTDNRLENLNLLDHTGNSNWGTRNERISKTMTGRQLTEEHKKNLAIARLNKKQAS